MKFEEEAVLRQILAQTCYYPHPECNSGSVIIPEPEVFISPLAKIDLTGSVTIGKYSMIGHGTQIFTHDHYHLGREPLLLLQDKLGVKWADKVIGEDVWLHGCTVLMQVTEIPSGVVIGAGSVLTKNPEPYEIWSGNPAIPTGYRTIYPDTEYRAEIDYALANYICGFVDGEGSFSITKNDGYPQFRFAMESDYRDHSLYDDIALSLNCGHLSSRHRKNSKNRMVIFTVGDFKSLVEIIIPFFDTFKLKGLKLIKYLKWREQLLDYITKNPLKKKLNSIVVAGER